MCGRCEALVLGLFWATLKFQIWISSFSHNPRSHYHACKLPCLAAKQGRQEGGGAGNRVSSVAQKIAPS